MMNELNDFQFKVILQCEQERFNPTKQYCEYLVEMNGVERPLKDILKENIEQQSIIDKEKELLKLIANACSFNKEHSVKEILRNEIKGIDTVTYESANAWHDYVLLSEFFEKHYKEYWDNE